MFETSLWDLKLERIDRLRSRVVVRNLPMGFETQSIMTKQRQTLRSKPPYGI